MTLPNWSQVDGRWICDDSDAMKWAQVFAIHGFNLPAFDAWLKDVRPSEAQAVLIERRGWAIEAAREGHAKWMRTALDLLRMVQRGDRREDALLPLARTGKKSRAGSAEANKARSDDASARHADWQARADRYWSNPLHSSKSASDVARLISKDTGDKANTIRREIKRR